MYSKSIITENYDPNINYQFSFIWENYHPGETLISFISEYLMPKVEKKVLEILTYEKYLILLHWDNKIQLGYIVIISFEVEKYLDDCINFAKSLWDLILTPIESYKKNENKEYDYSNSSMNYIFEIDWIKRSLMGGKIEFTIEKNREKFVSQFSNFLYVFRWSVYSLDYANFEQNRVIFHFHNQLIDQKYFTFEEYFLKITDFSDKQFQSLIDKIIILSFQFETKKRMETFLNNFHVINKLVDTEITKIDRIRIIKSNIEMMIAIDKKYIVNNLTNIVLSLPDQQNNEIFIDELLAISDILEKIGIQENEDIIKLIDGTILDIVINSNNIDKNEYIMKLTHKSLNWGLDHFIGYLNLIINIFSKDNIKLLLQIAGEFEKELIITNKGISCLVHINENCGEFSKAIELRLLAINLNKDETSKFYDTINSLIEIASYKEISLQIFESEIIKYFGYILTNFPDKEILEIYFNELITKFLDNNHTEIVISFIRWIQNNIENIENNERLNLFKILNSTILKYPELNKIQLKFQLLYFNQYLDQYSKSDDQNLLESADRLLKNIFNQADPLDSKYKETLTIITQSLVLSASKYQEWELIQEAIHRFSLLMNDKKYFQKAITKIYINAGKSRNQIKIIDKDKKDIGLKIFDETIRLISNNPNQINLAFSFLPVAKELALKSNDFNRFMIYSTLEMNLNKINGKQWIDSLIEAILNLINKNSIDYARQLFEAGLKIDMNEKEEYELLSRQLELAELELDIVNVEEISIKRKRLIELAVNNEGIATEDEIINSFRNGISEIMSKGNTHYLHSFLLKAIKFGVDNKINDLTDFYNALKDSFNAVMSDYKDNHDESSYSEIIFILRELYNIYQHNDKNIIFEYATIVLKTNNLLYNKDMNLSNLIKNLFIIKEFTNYFSTPDSIVEDVKLEEYINTVKDMFNLVSKEKNVSTMIKIIMGTLEFLIIFNEIEYINFIFNKIFSILKKSLIKEKAPNGLFIVTIIEFEKINRILKDYNKKELEKEFLMKIIKLIDVINTFKNLKNHELLDKFDYFRNIIMNDTSLGFKKFKEDYNEYIQLIDKVYISRLHSV